MKTTMQIRGFEVFADDYDMFTHRMLVHTLANGNVGWIKGDFNHLIVLIQSWVFKLF